MSEKKPLVGKKKPVIFALALYGLSVGFKYLFFSEAVSTCTGLFFFSDALPALAAGLLFLGYLRARALAGEKKRLEKFIRSTTASVNNPLNLIMAQLVVLKSHFGEEQENLRLVELSAKKIGLELNRLATADLDQLEREEKEQSAEEKAVDVEAASRGLSL